MGQPDIRPEYSQERLEEALRLDAAANVRFARELAVVSSRVFGVGFAMPSAHHRRRGHGSVHGGPGGRWDPMMACSR